MTLLRIRLRYPFHVLKYGELHLGIAGPGWDRHGLRPRRIWSALEARWKHARHAGKKIWHQEAVTYTNETPKCRCRGDKKFCRFESIFDSITTDDNSLRVTPVSGLRVEEWKLRDRRSEFNQPSDLKSLLTLSRSVEHRSPVHNRRRVVRYVCMYIHDRRVKFLRRFRMNYANKYYPKYEVHYSAVNLAFAGGAVSPLKLN